MEATLEKEVQEKQKMEKQHYDFPLDLSNPSNVHAIELSMINPNSYVLDVGCHTGILGEILTKHRDCRVVGIDQDETALAIARTRLEQALSIDLEAENWSSALTDEGLGRFDFILFGDVLEHTRNPEQILNEAKKLLKPRGRVIVSVPNVANLRIRLALLRGKFEYQDSGILDRTHLRFFTNKTARELIERAGYRILLSNVAGYRLPHWLISLFPGLLAVQIVLCGEVAVRD